mmetsp:Transcript_54997/g.110424  ORF Transcript_54997/g.110424 Transcript_54997/m.110424 type:complete len:217 (+) Transcript_54997:256-906(+)
MQRPGKCATSPAGGIGKSRRPRGNSHPSPPPCAKAPRDLRASCRAGSPANASLLLPGASRPEILLRRQPYLLVEDRRINPAVRLEERAHRCLDVQVVQLVEEGTNCFFVAVLVEQHKPHVPRRAIGRNKEGVEVVDDAQEHRGGRPDDLVHDVQGGVDHELLQVGAVLTRAAAAQVSLVNGAVLLPDDDQHIDRGWRCARGELVHRGRQRRRTCGE